MSNNSWIAPVSAIAGIIILGLGYNMYSNKEATANTAKYYADLAKEDLDSRFGGRRSKRRKYRKNASKKKR
jgi:hypothetical protein